MAKFTLQFSKQTLQAARSLRRNMSNTERAVWQDLRGDQLGVRFRRQVPLGPYILDFFCIEAMLAVELDGPEHRTPAALAHDARRDAYMRERGVRTLRFENQRVHLHWEEVLEEIKRELQARVKRKL